MVTNFGQYFFFEGEKVGLESNSLVMNHKISVYYVDWGVVIRLLLALVVQCRFFFCSKVLHRYNDTLLSDHMSRYSYANRYTKVSKGVSGYSAR